MFCFKLIQEKPCRQRRIWGISDCQAQNHIQFISILHLPDMTNMQPDEFHAAPVINLVPDFHTCRSIGKLSQCNQTMSKMPRNHIMDNFLVITALADNTPDFLEQFTRVIKDCSGNILESRITVLGNAMCISMMVSGSWDAIAKVEDTLSRQEGRLGMSVKTSRTSPSRAVGNLMPYAIDVVSFNHIGIVHDIVNFMLENKIGIQDMQTNTYKANNTGTTMFSLHMAINIPADISIAAIRGDFMDFCDQLNLDAIMEPVK